MFKINTFNFIGHKRSKFKQPSFLNRSLDFANFRTDVTFYYWLLMLKILCRSNLFKGTLKNKYGQKIGFSGFQFN